MVILGLDTTGPDCSACVMKDGSILAEQSIRIGRGHAERLGPMVMEVLADAKVEPSQIDRLAVCTGPGSFTGLRVALSFAKGFALPRALPIIGIDRLTAVLADHPEAIVICDIKRGDAALATAGQSPIILSHADAEKRASAHDGPVLRDPILLMATMTRLAETADPAAYPPEPFYGRAPDAKLPGGLTPPPASLSTPS